ncbi:MAG: leucine-rich repeat domain-containing protein, partial [Saccharofermentans sp.]|nr:leucine-rich repeat domain-containing protein [Saccharofermentans sp.]
MNKRLLKYAVMLIAFVFAVGIASIPATVVKADGDDTIAVGQTKKVDFKSEQIWWYKYSVANPIFIECTISGSNSSSVQLYKDSKTGTEVGSSSGPLIPIDNSTVLKIYLTSGTYYFKVSLRDTTTPVTNNDSKISLKNITDSTVVAKINDTNFPDEAFRNYVTGFDCSGDGVLTKDEISVVSSISVKNAGINDFTGIGYFSELMSFECPQNSFSTLNLSKNKNVMVLDCSDNPNLTSVNLSKCTELFMLSCDNCKKLQQLDLSKCNSLYVVNCSDCGLKSLDISNKSSLHYLYCSNNNIETLNLSGCSNLETLECDNNKIKSLDVSSCSYLTTLRCNNNDISTLKLNSDIKVLDCSTNKLKTLNIKTCPDLINLSCKNNDLSKLDISGCPWLVAVYKNGTYYPSDGYYGKYFSSGHDCILSIDSGLEITTNNNSSDEVVEINDTNFKDAFFREVISKYDQDGDGWLDKLEISMITDLNLDYKNITDLSGIEYLSELKKLSCDQVPLSKLDVSKNKKLEYLVCEETDITKLDLSQNINLKILYCGDNKIEKLDLSKLSKLEYLDCSGNLLETLDVSKNTKLIYLLCFGNKLSSLNLGKITTLKSLACYGNNLKSIDIAYNSLLVDLYRNTEKSYMSLDGGKKAAVHMKVSSLVSLEVLVYDDGLKITDTLPVSLTLNKNEANIVCGKTLTLTATLKNSTETKTWKSSDSKVASVDSNGKITAKMAGKATITVTAAGKSAKCVVTVLYKDVTNSSDFWYAPT